jgi:hypothetical protein
MLNGSHFRWQLPDLKRLFLQRFEAAWAPEKAA